METSFIERLGTPGSAVDQQVMVSFGDEQVVLVKRFCKGGATTHEIE